MENKKKAEKLSRQKVGVHETTIPALTATSHHLMIDWCLFILIIIIIILPPDPLDSPLDYVSIRM